MIKLLSLIILTLNKKEEYRMTNPLLQTDFYKVSHMLLYPEGTQYVYETLTPRKNSYFPWNDKMTVFGYELFFHRLHERFQKEFFDLTVEEAVDPVVDTIAEVLSQDVADKVKPQFVKLHELGYLPLRVQSLPEGVLVPMQVPVLTIENTDPDFYWLPGYLETSLLSDTFVTSTVASTTRQFKVSGYKYALKTGAISLGKAIEAKLFLDSKKKLSDITDVDESIDYTDFQFHDFSERGQHGNEAALLSGIAHLTSSHGTDIIQAVNYVRNNYQDKGNLVGASVLATEHSVMEAYGTDQYKAYETLLKNNPTGILSVVSDTYDYWEVINDVLPALKDLIMSRDGKLVVRPDTSDQYFSGFSDDTEVLTKNGWVPITSIKEDTLIGTVDKGNKLVFSKPVKLSRSQYSGNMVHFRDNFGKLDLLVTPEYELLINQANKKGTIKERKVMANTVAKRGNAGQKHNRSAELNNVGVSLSNEERLNIAFQADGDKMEYGMASNKMKFQFSKQRKLSRLSTILDALGYDYKVSRSSRAKGNSAEEYKFTITLPSGFKKQPTFSWVVPELFLKGSKWAKEFIEEVSHWDASIRGEGRIKYDSTIKINSDAVELVALMAGYGSYTSVHQDNRKEYFLDTHTVNILKDNSIGGQSRVKENLVVTDMNITSVKVTTGKLLIKRNNGYLVANDNSNNMVGVETMLVDTLQSMWDTFGGTVDENGIKVLDSHIGLLHGEGVSLDNIDEYFEAITNAGYSPENIVFGVGAYVYSVQASRDSFGQALKATSVTIKGEEKKVFKDPKTVSESFKKSLKGRVRVVMGDKGYEVQDDLLFTEVGKDNELKTIYEPSQGKTESLVTPFEVIRKRIDMSAVIEGATKVAKD